MKVKFNQDVAYNGMPYASKDSVHDLSEDMAWRWIRRGMAVQLIEEEKKPFYSGKNSKHKGQQKQSLDLKQEPEQNGEGPESLL